MSRIIDADKLLEELKMMLDEGFLVNHCSNYNCDHEPRCTFCYIKRAIFILKKQPTISEDFTEDLLNMGYTKGYNKALDDLISKAEDERDNIYNWEDDEYENGMRSAYQDMIEMAQHWKEGEINGSSNSRNS